MEPSIEQTELMCSVCGRTTLQEAAYAGRLLTHVTCIVCGTVTSLPRDDLRDEYIADLRQRIRSKPRRLLHRAAKHPLRFFRALPAAILRQPKKIFRELRAVKSEGKPPQQSKRPQR